MKNYVLPFDYGKSTQMALKIAGKTGEHDDQMNTPEKYKALLTNTDFGSPMYITKLQRRGWREHCGGQLEGPDRWGTALEDKHKGRTAFIVCPGPSLKDTLPDRKAVEGKLTIAVNSAWFGYTCYFWCMAEAKYTKWLWANAGADLEAKQGALLRQDLILTPRAAGWWWKREKTFRPGRPKRARSYRYLYVTRFEELGQVPFPVDGTSTFNALCAAWWMGCSDVVLFGLDLAKPGGQSYIDGVPFSDEGAHNPYEPQIECMKFAQWPGLTIHNVNPYSNAFGLPFEAMSKEEAWDLLNRAPLLESGGRKSE